MNKSKQSKPNAETIPVQPMPLLCGHVRAGETDKAIQACNDFLRMGVARSLRGLLHYYYLHQQATEQAAQQATQNSPKTAKKEPLEAKKEPKGTKRNHLEGDFYHAEQFFDQLSRNTRDDWRETVAVPATPFSPPTLSLSTLKKWSADYDWVRRAAEFDLAWEQEKNAIREAECESGLALDYVRTRALKHLGKMLHEHIFEESNPDDNKEHCSPFADSPSRAFHNVWVPDVKIIGIGESAETRNYESFNAPLISQYRGVLGEIARETGGRRPMAHVETFLKRLRKRIDIRKLTPSQLDRVSSGDELEWLLALLEPFLLKEEDEDVETQNTSAQSASAQNTSAQTS